MWHEMYKKYKDHGLLNAMFPSEIGYIVKILLL